MKRATFALLVALTLAISPADSPRAGTPAQVSADDDWASGFEHYARGEYRQAADAFARVGARVEPVRKPEARYWAGLSWLGAQDAAQARSAFEDVASVPSQWRALAQLGLAHAWELSKRPDRAIDVLTALTRDDAGEAGAAALSRLATLAAAAGEVDVARHAHERLLREYPGSMEAASARLADGSPPEARRPIAVQLGAFSEPTRARALADVARQAGLGEVRVVERAEGGMKLHVVMLGPYAKEADARRSAARASERLGVVARVVSAP
jgi:tetratricopeptide (TPR) repeat protein